MSVVSSVEDTRHIAEHLGMREVSYVSRLAGRWHLPGVELVAHQQWPNLVVAVYAAPGPELTGRDGWDARLTAGTPTDVVVGLVQRAQFEQVAA